MVVAFCIMASLSCQVQALAGASHGAGGHYLSSLQPHIPHVRLRAFSRDQLAQVDQCRQSPAHTSRYAGIAFHAFFGRVCTQSHHISVRDPFAVAVNQVTGNSHFCRGVREIDEITIIYVRAVDKPPHFPDQRLLIDVYFPVRGTVQKLKAVKKGGSGPAPVPRALVAAAVRMIGGDKTIQAAHDFLHCSHAPGTVGLEQKGGGEPVGIAPRIPVVDMIAAESHPPEIVPFQAGLQHSITRLAQQPGVDQRGDLVKLRADQVMHPGQQGHGLGTEKVHHRLLHVRKPGPCSLRADMRRNDPA